MSRPDHLAAVAEPVRPDEATDAQPVAGDMALITALAAGQSVADAARAAGLSDRTVRRRLQDPTFSAAVDLSRAELLEEALGLLSGTASIAVKVLRVVAADKSSGATARVAAAGRLLDATLRYREHLDLARRVEALERAQTVAP